MIKKNVLIVDDEESVKRFLVESLRFYGYKVDGTSSYEDTEKLISKKHYDAIILDVKLKDRDSLDLIEKIKNQYPNVCIIMMSGYGTIDIAVKALKLGASDFLEKPFSLDRLTEILENLLENKEKILVGNYILKNKIGEGGTSKVFKAKHKSLLRTSAVKILKKSVLEDKSFLVRFIKEARLTASLNHKNIVNIYDYGESKFGYFIAMEYVDGISLNDLIDEDDISLNVYVSICAVICRTLSHAHEKGVIHRDLKLENVLIGEEGLKLVDFGLAKTSCGKGNITHSNKIVGTPLYMSPEQVLGKKVTHKCDIFSVGVILYKLLTGKFPFYNQNNMVLMKLISDGKFKKPSEICKSIDKKLERIIIKALNHKAQDRYRSSAILAGKLEDWLKLNGILNAENEIIKYYSSRKKGIVRKKENVRYHQNKSSRKVKKILFPFLTLFRSFPNRKQGKY